MFVRNCSTLYVSRDKNVTAVVNVDLQFDELLSRNSEIESSLQKRQLKFDLQHLVGKMRFNCETIILADFSSIYN